MNSTNVWVSLLGIAVLAVCLGCLLPFEIGFNLAFGWVFFLARVWPNVRLDPAGAAIAIVCGIGLMLGLHWFAAWLYAAAREPKAVEGWRWRWTGAILAGVMVMFVAGIAAVGIAHQAAWLARSPGPIASSQGPLAAAIARVQASNRLKLMGQATHEYHHWNKRLPAGGTFDAQGNGLHGWQTLLLPHVEQENLYRMIDLRKPWDAPENVPHFYHIIPEYQHPAGGEPQPIGKEFGLSHYAANVHLLNGAKPLTLNDVADGTANTILAGEVWAHYRPWGYPANWRDPARGIHTTPDSFGSPIMADGAQFLMADGSVRFVNRTVSRGLLKALATPAAGDEPMGDW